MSVRFNFTLLPHSRRIIPSNFFFFFFFLNAAQPDIQQKIFSYIIDDATVVTLLDLSAAFDTVDHNILSQRLDLKDLSTSMEFLVHLSSGSDPTFPELRLLPSTTNCHSRPCLTLAFRKALSWDLFYSFCTQNLVLHSFDNTPFLTSLSQTAPSCTIPAIQIKWTPQSKACRIAFQM